MTAMHKATDNAQALKNDLVIFYNKARQCNYQRNLEIVSGAEALKINEIVFTYIYIKHRKYRCFYF
jgi:hypothetical protein